MHPPHVKQAALELIAAGHSDCEVARRLGVPRRTVMDWRRPTYVRQAAVEVCPRCWRTAKPMVFAPGDYSQLLAVYLGDGWISRGPRSYRLRIALDNRYPALNEEIKTLVQRCFPANAVAPTIPTRSSWSGRNDTWTVLSTYSVHFPCLFPQHGIGRKHERRILLEDWQAETVAECPWRFIRGCIQTDGCSFINRTDVHRAKPYEYRSYQFFNRSKDIVDLFVEACGMVSVACRVTGSEARGWSVRINRRPCVALMLEHVGLKS
jgi:Homeodomain-like domain